MHGFQNFLIKYTFFNSKEKLLASAYSWCLMPCDLLFALSLNETMLIEFYDVQSKAQRF